MASGPGLPYLPSDLLTANHSAAKYTPGKTFTVDTRTNCRFLYAKVTIGGTAANTLSPGRPVWWDRRDEGTTYTDASTAVDKEFAGVLCGTLTSGNYGWICTYGPFYGIVAPSIAIGITLAASQTAGNFVDIGTIDTMEIPVGRTLIATAANSQLPLVGVAPVFAVSVVNGAVSAVTITSGGTGVGTGTGAGNQQLTFYSPSGGNRAAVTPTVAATIFTAMAVSAGGSGYSAQEPPVLVNAARCMIFAPGG